MKENIDPKLYKKYNEKLVKAGMPEELEPIAVPLNTAEALNSATGVLMELVPEIEKSLEKYKTLDPKFQDDILLDLKKQRNDGILASQIIDRFEVLVYKSQELGKLTSADSDKKPKSKTNLDETDKKREKEKSEQLDTLIRDMEYVIRRDNFTPGKNTH